MSVLFFAGQNCYSLLLTSTHICDDESVITWLPWLSRFSGLFCIDLMWSIGDPSWLYFYGLWTSNNIFCPNIVPCNIQQEFQADSSSSLNTTFLWNLCLFDPCSHNPLQSFFTYHISTYPIGTGRSHILWL